MPRQMIMDHTGHSTHVFDRVAGALVASHDVVGGRAGDIEKNGPSSVGDPAPRTVERGHCSRDEIERALNRVARGMKFRLYVELARLNFLLFKLKLSRIRVALYGFLLRYLC